MKADIRAVFLQCLLVFGCLSVLLLLYDLLGGVIVASLGASSCMIFVTPHSKFSRTRRLVIGYVLGCASGVAFGFLRQLIPDLPYLQLLLTAAAAATAIFLMVAAQSVHPSAAAIAITVSLGPAYLPAAASALAGILILCAVRGARHRHLKNLV